MNQAGIDVSNRTFDIQRRSGEVLSRRVCLDATGIYHLQLALALDRAAGIEVMVVNPRASRRFAEAQMVRAKTDRVDAAILLQYVERMPFTVWTAPAEQLLELQSLAHRLAQLKKEQVRERSRLHAAQRAGKHTGPAQQDIRDHLRYLQLLDSVPGIAELSAMKLIAELGVLAEGLSAAQWVAQAGLDPRPQESGTSVRSPRRISKQGNARLRAALFLPPSCANCCMPSGAYFSIAKNGTVESSTVCKRLITLDTQQSIYRFRFGIVGSFVDQPSQSTQPAFPANPRALPLIPGSRRTDHGSRSLCVPRNKRYRHVSLE